MSIFVTYERKKLQSKEESEQNKGIESKEWMNIHQKHLKK